jgi:hypothetical protein
MGGGVDSLRALRHKQLLQLLARAAIDKPRAAVAPRSEGFYIACSPPQTIGELRAVG